MEQKKSEKKRQKAKEWHRQEAVIMSLKKPKQDKKKFIIVEEAEPIVESHSLIVEPTREEMVGTVDVLEPNVEAEAAGMASEPEPENEEVVVKVPMHEPKL